MPPRGHLAMSGDVVDGHNLGEGCSWHLVGRDQQYCTGQTPPHPLAKNHLTPNASDAAVGNNLLSVNLKSLLPHNLGKKDSLSF